MNVKLGFNKAVISLIFFQSIAGLICLEVLYVLNGWSLLPKAFDSRYHSGFMAALMGSYVYGYWIEKKFPHAVDCCIKKLSSRATLIVALTNFTAFFVLIFLNYKNFGTPIKVGSVIAGLFVMGAFLTVYYFGTKSLIRKGIDVRHKVLLKNQKSNMQEKINVELKLDNKEVQLPLFIAFFSILNFIILSVSVAGTLATIPAAFNEMITAPLNASMMLVCEYLAGATALIGVVGIWCLKKWGQKILLVGLLLLGLYIAMAFFTGYLKVVLGEVYGCFGLIIFNTIFLIGVRRYSSLME